MTGRTRAQQKAAAFLRAQLSLKQALERIDFAHDVIAPKLLEIRAMEKGNEVGVTGELEAPDAEADADA